MRVLWILGLIVGLAIFANAQTAVLSGTIYDANGAVIVGAKVGAVNEKLQKFEVITNDERVYKLDLPVKKYDSKDSFKIAKYALLVQANGFEKFVLKGLNFVPSHSGKMLLDVALDLPANTNCGAGGCIPEPNLSKPQTPILANEIISKPLVELPKARNKTKRKTINNK